MLQSMRENAKSWGTVIIVAIIAFMMAVTGLESLAPGVKSKSIAVVNGEEISRVEFFIAQEQQKRMLMQRMGDRFDPSLINAKLLQDAVLDGLIEKTLQMQDAKAHSMVVSDEELDKKIIAMPEFQKSGKFDRDYYVKLIRNVGMTPQQFRKIIREETIQNQLRYGLVSSEFITSSEAGLINALEKQTRDISWQIIDIDPFRESVLLTEDEIKNYYNTHQDDYMSTEEVVIQYIELSKKDLSLDVVIDEDSVQKEYNARLDVLRNDGLVQTRVSTILLAINEKKDRESALKIADEIKGKLAKGDKFEKLASIYSDDTFSAKKGGDLGYVRSGFFGDQFDETVDFLEVGRVSEPIETLSGVQILKVTERKKKELPTLESLREDILVKLRLDKVDSMYLEKVRRLEEVSFEAPDLEQPAKELGIVLKTSEAFGRKGTTSGIASSSKVITAIFSEDVLNLRVNSDVIEVEPGRVIVLRIQDYRVPELKGLDEVKEAISKTLKRNTAKKQILAMAKERLKFFKEDPERAKGEKWKIEKKITRSSHYKVSRDILKKVFSMPKPVDDIPSYDYIILANGNLVIISVDAVYTKLGEKLGEEESMLKQYLGSHRGRQTYNEYLEFLKNKADIVKHVPDINSEYTD